MDLASLGRNEICLKRREKWETVLYTLEVLSLSIFCSLLTEEQDSPSSAIIRDLTLVCDRKETRLSLQSLTTHPSDELIPTFLFSLPSMPLLMSIEKEK